MIFGPFTSPTTVAVTVVAAKASADTVTSVAVDDEERSESDLVARVGVEQLDVDELADLDTLLLSTCVDDRIHRVLP